VIPPLTNEFVILIKDTSLTAVLGLTLSQQELMATGRDIFAQTFNATPFLASAAGYLAVTLPLIRLVTWLEARLR
jgi:polar amino acid transport system permease protein